MAFGGFVGTMLGAIVAGVGAIGYDTSASVSLEAGHAHLSFGVVGGLIVVGAVAGLVFGVWAAALSGRP